MIPGARGLLARGAVVCAVVLGIVGLGALPASAAEDDDDVSVHVSVPERSEAVTAIDDAELRWGINRESGSGAFAGGCNFLSAGRAGDAGSAREWTAADGFYRSSAGDVSIVKADASGRWVPATWETRCLDRRGQPVRASDLTTHTETQVVWRGGTGSVAADGAVTIRWSGSFTVAYYGGMTYWSVTDPVLTMDADGDGRIVARLSGFATSRDDLGQWSPVSASDVVLADLRDAPLDEGGFARVPEYVGVRAGIPGQAARDSSNTAHWGAFPASFLRFQERTGQAGYWMTTGGQRDAAKLPSMLYVNYDGDDPAVAPVSDPVLGSGSLIENAVVERPSATSSARRLAATPADAPPTVAPPGQASVVSASEGLVVPASEGVLPPILVPAAATGLALVVALLAGLNLAGVPIRVFSWRL